MTLECVGLDAETPASAIMATLSSASINPIGLSRSAILKFQKNSDIVPALKDLKSIEVEEVRNFVQKDSDIFIVMVIRVTMKAARTKYSIDGPYKVS